MAMEEGNRPRESGEEEEMGTPMATDQECVQGRTIGSKRPHSEAFYGSSKGKQSLDLEERSSRDMQSLDLDERSRRDMQSLDLEEGSSRGTAAPGRIPISHYFIFAVTKCEFKINVLL